VHTTGLTVASWWGVRGLVSGLLTLLVWMPGAARAEPPSVSVSREHVTVTMTPRRGGLQIAADGVTVVKHSSLVVTRPPWAPHYYVGPTLEAIHGARVEESDDVRRITLTHVGQNDSFRATETTTLLPGGVVEQTFEGVLLEPDAKALVQWRIGALNPAILIGMPYEAVLADGERVQGRVPVVAKSSDRKESTLAEGFRELTFQSRIGSVKIEVDWPRKLVVYDYRKDRWAEPRDPYFWFGDLGSQFKTGEPMRYSVRYHLPRMDTDTKGQPLNASADIQRRPHAQTWPAEHPPRIVPKPKEVTWGPGHCDVTGWIAKLRAGESISSGADGTCAVFGKELLARFGEAVTATGTDSPPLRYAGLRQVEFVPGVYRIVVSPGGVSFIGADAETYRFAERTLMQMLTVTPDGRLVVPVAQIRDWPALRFRGVHLFTGGKGPALHQKLIRNVLGALKMNHLILECEYTEWDGYPQIHHPEYGMPKDDVRAILQTCREQQITVTPLLMTLGHCQWMFELGHFLDLAEDPEAKWAYCVTNPDTYEFIFTVLQETLDLFECGWLHIGHDEYTDRGRVPFRESSKPYTVEQLFVKDTLKLHGWLKERGVRTLMWGDMLLAKGEAPDACHAKSTESAAKLRDELPDDIIITDWHYAGTPPETFTSLSLFHEEGHETIAAVWYRPLNIVNFAKAAYDQNALGLLQTTWAGYSLDEESFARELHQYTAYVLAAEAAWNANEPPDPQTYAAGEIFLEQMGMTSLWPANRAGWTADLSEAYNASLAAKDAAGWFGLGPEHDLSKAPGGIVRLRGLQFQLGEPAGRSVLAFQSKLSTDDKRPTEVRIALGAKAAQMALLCTTDFAAQAGTPVAECRLHLADGSVHKQPIVYGEHVLAHTDLNAAANAPVVWTGQTPGGRRVGLRVLLIDNLKPTEVIEALTITSAGSEAGLLVLGLSGLEGKQR
jgi:hexosaminidase